MFIESKCFTFNRTYNENAANRNSYSLQCQKGNGEAVPVELAVFIKEKLINFNPEPSTSADIVIKEEVVVCSEDYIGSSADVPSSTEPTSHVTLSVACLGKYAHERNCYAPKNTIAKRAQETTRRKIRNETSEDKQSRLTNIGERTAEESKTQQQDRLEHNRLSKLKIKLLKKEENEKSERKFYQELKKHMQRGLPSELKKQKQKNNVKADWNVSVYGTSELDRQKQKNNVKKDWNVSKRIRQTETENNVKKDWNVSVCGIIEIDRQKHQSYVKKRLEKERVCKSRFRKTEKPQKREKDWKLTVHAGRNPELLKLKNRGWKHWKNNAVKNKEDVMLVEPTVVIKEEPIQFDPEPLSSQDKVMKHNRIFLLSSISKRRTELLFPVDPTVVIKEEPMSFEPEPSSSADIVIKDEFVVCSEDDTGSSADVPPSTVPTSHVTLSVACLGSGQKPCSDQ
ncbi:hypothetical protein CEXT_198891 [Caerostris extrusa]|uniref:Uncharacterized protein n=1 Tax=Caerostris extrusa TaxID=172846 RepID=A0AAV4WG79_CAEEX|nr:hypothetical protein CEXT_198891 [Caerostris extrusa]